MVSSCCFGTLDYAIQGVLFIRVSRPGPGLAVSWPGLGLVWAQIPGPAWAQAQFGLHVQRKIGMLPTSLDPPAKMSMLPTSLYHPAKIDMLATSLYQPAHVFVISWAIFYIVLGNVFDINVLCPGCTMCRKAFP